VKAVTALLLLLLGVAPEARSGTVARLTLQMPIGPVAVRVIEKSLTRAFEGGVDALVIELDTPGGLDESMRIICRRLLNADLPVVVYVAPSGARAASAGLFITYSAHVAAMAPGTNIGAAHVVNMGGEMDSVMSTKVQNDAVAYITSIAKKRGRNVEWATRAVLESVSIDAQAALDSHVVDIVASSFEDLLKQLDGRAVTVGNTTDTLHLAEASVTRYEMGFKDRFLTVITNPTVAFILFNLGWMGLLLELYSPGTLVPGIVGGICIILAFFAFQQLPISYAGLALIIFAVILFILEVKITSYGLLGIGGVISMLLGSLLLIDASAAPWLKISLSVILITVGAMAAFFLFLIVFVVKAHRRKPTTGREALVGAEGDVRPGGMVFLEGELWRADCDEPLETGDRVKVLAVANMRIKVAKIGRQL